MESNKFPKRSRKRSKGTPKVPGQVLAEKSVALRSTPRKLNKPQNLFGLNLARSFGGRNVLLIAAVLLLTLVLTLGALNLIRPVPAAQIPFAGNIQVEGRIGAPVTVKLEREITTRDLGMSLVEIGSGPTLQSGQPALVRATQFDLKGTTATSAHGGQILVGPLGADIFGQYLAENLQGVRIGSRLLFVTKKDGGTTLQLSVVDVLPLEAQGEVRPVPPDAPAWPENSDGHLQLVGVTESVKRDEWSATVIEGQGRQVTINQNVIAQIATFSGRDGSLQNSTWDKSLSPVLVKLGEAMAPVAAAVENATVGSRLIVAVPAEAAHGHEPLFVVIDILTAISER